MQKDNSKNIIELLRRGDKATLQKVYSDNREAFINFSKKYGVNSHDAQDIYQDAILVLHKNAVMGKINNLNSSVSTYLFAIGKYKIFHTFRENSKIQYRDDIEISEKSFDYDVNLYPDNLTNQQRLMKAGLNKLGERCRDILTLFYYQGYTLDEITDILKYSDKKVLKSQKSRCMKHLKELTII